MQIKPVRRVSLSTLALFAAVLTIPVACLDSAVDADADDPDFRAYNPDSEAFEIYGEHGSVSAQNTRVKSFYARVEPLTEFEVTITKDNGYNTDFEVIFSATPVAGIAQRWGDGSTACANHGTGQAKSKACTVNVPNGAQHAYVLVRAVNETHGSDFILDRRYQGYCPDKSCFGSDEIRVTGLSKAPKKPVVNGSEPVLLAGQNATVEVYRTHGNVIIQNGIKLKDLNDPNPKTNLRRTVMCGDWDNGRTTCNLGVLAVDAGIHVPLKLTNNKKANRKACVVITRAGDGTTTQSDPDARNPCP